MTSMTPDVPGTTHPPGDDQRSSEEETTHYLDLIRTVHEQWDALESQQDEAAQRHHVREAVMAAVRADTRHGAQVRMPPTEEGPYTLTELSLRTLVRQAVDSVWGARSLRSSFEHANPEGRQRELGEPVQVHCRVSAHRTVTNLPELADQIRSSVRATLSENLGLSPAVDVHIEDLHDDDH